MTSAIGLLMLKRISVYAIGRPRKVFLFRPFNYSDVSQGECTSVSRAID